MSETLPDDHTRTLALTLTVAEFRELMIAGAYRLTELTEDGPEALALKAGVDSLGGAWNAVDPADEPDERSLVERALRHALEVGDEHATEALVKRLEAIETPTVCAECGRTRPRWTMEAAPAGLVCSPKNAMHCGACCTPGEYLVHYTEEEHQHQAEEWLLVTLDTDGETHAAVPGRKIPICGIKGKMTPADSDSGPTCLPCRRALHTAE